METACQGWTYELLFDKYSTLRICKSEISREEKLSEVYCIVWITGKVLKYPPTSFIEELGKQFIYLYKRRWKERTCKVYNGLQASKWNLLTLPVHFQSLQFDDVIYWGNLMLCPHGGSKSFRDLIWKLKPSLCRSTITMSIVYKRF